jgi:hypothetical protein
LTSAPERLNKFHAEDKQSHTGSGIQVKEIFFRKIVDLNHQSTFLSFYFLLKNPALSFVQKIIQFIKVIQLIKGVFITYGSSRN